MSSVRHNGNGQQHTSRTTDTVWRAPSAPQCAGEQGRRRGPDHDLALHNHNYNHRGAHTYRPRNCGTPLVWTTLQYHCPLRPASHHKCV